MVMRNLIKQHLLSLGFEHIDFASNGNEAIDRMEQGAFTKRPYHIVLLDWHMPEMEGIEVLQKARTNTKHDNTAIVMLTAEQEERNVIKAIGMGATSYLIKPVTKDALNNCMNKICSWLDGKGVLSTVDPQPAAAPVPQAINATQINESHHQKLFEKIKTDLNPIVSSGIKGIFSEIFQTELVETKELGEHHKKQMVCVGRLSQPDFTVDMRFFFDHMLLKPLLSQMYSPEFLKNENVYHDSACEIVNILCAQVKAFLNKNGFDLDMDIPKMGSTNEELNKNSASLNICFSLNEQNFVMIDLETA
jgi:two-component system chemotaxis response regulator CheY